MKKIEIFFKRLFLRWILFSGRRKKSDAQVKLSKGDKVLCIRLNRIGDALVVTPFLHHLKLATGCEITVLADRHNHFVFRNNPDIDNVIIYEKGAEGTGKLLKKINNSGYKAVFDLHDDVSVTVSYILKKLKVHYVAGLRRANAQLFTHVIDKPDSTKIHVIDRCLRLIELVDGDHKVDGLLTTPSIRYFPSKEDIENVNRYFADKFTGSEFVVGINISAGSMARYWGTENFKKLVEYLKEKKIEYLLLCSTRDIKLSLEIDPYSERTYYTPGFGEFCAMVGKINLLFSPDTATVHLASIYNIPVFGLYVKYATEDIIWYPYNTRYEAIVTSSPTLKDVKFLKVMEKFDPFLNDELKRHEHS